MFNSENSWTFRSLFFLALNKTRRIAFLKYAMRRISFNFGQAGTYLFFEYGVSSSGSFARNLPSML